MKRKTTTKQTTLLLSLVLIAVSSYAQLTGENFNGIYRSANDLDNNHISNLAKGSPLNDVMTRMDHNLVLIREGHEQKVRFGEIKGYFKDGYKFRAYGKKSFFSPYGYYKVLDESGLIVYSKTVSGHKTGSHTWYYYSKHLDSPIKRINRRNLKKDFSDSPGFITDVMQTFRKRTSLAERNAGVSFNDLYHTYVKNEQQ